VAVPANQRDVAQPHHFDQGFSYGEKPMSNATGTGERQRRFEFYFS
jgi:hypothetical protein